MANIEKTSTSNSNDKDVKDCFIEELDTFLKFGKVKEEKSKEGEEEEGKDKLKVVKQSNKRKRANEDVILLEDVLSMFLRILYPLSRDMKKFVVVGLNKTIGCKPAVMINQNGKNVVLNETAWSSLDKRMQLVDCYMNNKIFGKKTNFSLLGSDIEVDIVILRGEQYVRIRDVTKHDLKVQLTYEEFSMLHSSSAAINHYISQLHIVESCCEDYVTNTIETLPNAQILYSPLDTSVMNRLPQEVELYRRMVKNEALNESRKKEPEIEEYNFDTDESGTEANSQEKKN